MSGQPGRTRLLAVAVMLSSALVTWSAVRAQDQIARSAVDISAVRSFETRFTEQVTTLIRTPALRQAKETTIVNTKVWRDIVDRTVYKTTDAKALRGITTTELQALRALVLDRADEATALAPGIKRGASDLLSAKVERDFVTTRILAPQPQNSALLSMRKDLSD